MFERFTERLRKVMSLARQEAQAMNSGFIGTEHLLIGIMVDGAGVAAKILANMKVDLKSIRLETGKRTKPSKDQALTLGQIPFSGGAKTVIEIAGEASCHLGSDVIGTEHLLLGLLREGESTAFQVLRNLSVSAAEVNKAVADIMAADEKASEKKVCSRCGGTGREPAESK